MAKLARLRIYGHGEVEVALVTAYLSDLAHAYNSILVFHAEIDVMRRSSRGYPPQFGYEPWARARASRYVRTWPPTEKQITSRVPISEQFLLSAVRLTSPGFWEFLGTLNPLEVTRQYLNDRHERRKDREYREAAERRRLELENLSLENQVLSERVRIAREIGATDDDLAPLLNELVYKPLVALNRYQDQGVIENAEIVAEPEVSGET